MCKCLRIRRKRKNVEFSKLSCWTLINENNQRVMKDRFHGASNEYYTESIDGTSSSPSTIADLPSTSVRSLMAKSSTTLRPLPSTMTEWQPKKTPNANGTVRKKIINKALTTCLCKSMYKIPKIIVNINKQIQNKSETNNEKNRQQTENVKTLNQVTKSKVKPKTKTKMFAKKKISRTPIESNKKEDLKC